MINSLSVPKLKARNISVKDQELIKKVAKRVSDLKSCIIKAGPPCTDGRTIYLPFQDKSLSYYDLEGLAAHEGAHIRFRSIIDPELPKTVCDWNVQLGHLILNIVEDARIEFLLKQTFTGFWDEINFLNKRAISKAISEFPKSKQDLDNNSKLLIRFFILLLSIQGTEQANQIFHPDLNKSGSFVFKSKSIPLFWQKIKSLFIHLRKKPTFPMSIVVARQIGCIITEIIKDCEPWKEKEEKKDRNRKQSKGDDPSKGSKTKTTKLESLKDARSNFSDAPRKSNPDSSAPAKKLDDTRKTSMIRPESDKISKLKDERFKPISGTTTKESGLKLNKAKRNEKKLLEKLKNHYSKLSKKAINEDSSHDDLKELEKFHEDFYVLESEMEDILNRAKAIDPKLFVNISEKSVEKSSLDGIKVNSYLNSSELSKLNKISNADVQYSGILKENFPLIYQLRSKFDKIRKSNHMQRGQRYGYISGRDLSQVRISRGKFNRPFKSPNLGKGAQLLILIDESGSMSGARIQIAKKAAIILAESLKNTQIHFSLVGFAAKGGKLDVCEKVYKKMDDQVSPSKIGTIGISSEYSENRDGFSFKSCLKYFQKEGRIPKILIIISDGQPHHGGTSYIGELGIKHTKETIAQLKQQNIKLFAFSIDTSEKNYLKQIYGSQNYFLVKTLPQLPHILMNFVSEIVRALSNS
jgi:hypothetical protein